MGYSFCVIQNFDFPWLEKRYLKVICWFICTSTDDLLRLSRFADIGACFLSWYKNIVAIAVNCHGLCLGIMCRCIHIPIHIYLFIQCLYQLHAAINVCNVTFVSDCYLYQYLVLSFWKYLALFANVRRVVICYILTLLIRTVVYF